jgi:hypothetical protein
VGIGREISIRKYLRVDLAAPFDIFLDGRPANYVGGELDNVAEICTGSV